MRFEFATATRIIFGPGTLSELGRNASQFGRRALVVTGRSVQRAEPILRRLGGHGVEYVPFSVAGEPTTDEVVLGVQRAREKACDFVIGCGGGSAIDAAKAIAALLTNPGQLMDYFEVVGLGQALPLPGAPCLAIPTTAGTGAEVTKNSVLTSLEHRVKASLRSPHMLPRLALIDPELTFPLPPEVTATTGLDALTQLIEPYVSSRANPLTDALCLEGIRRVARSLRNAWEDPVNPGAREDMSLASVFGGLALANAGLGAVHGFAAPIGGMFHAPHGAVCAALLPQVMAANLAALREREPRHVSLPRYTAIARALTGAPDARAEDGIAWVRELGATLQIPALSAHEMDVTDIPAVVEKAAQASSMKANPIPLTTEELYGILARAL